MRFFQVPASVHANILYPLSILWNIWYLFKGYGTIHDVFQKAKFLVPVVPDSEPGLGELHVYLQLTTAILTIRFLALYYHVERIVRMVVVFKNSNIDGIFLLCI